MAETIDEWKQVAEQGNIDDFYKLIKKNVKLSEPIDELPIVDTPLHTLASAGHIPFSIEMMILKPSFASKRNEKGHIPIHLVLQKGHTEKVCQLLQHNADLVRVKGRECMTLLHYAAKRQGLSTLSPSHYEAKTKDYLALLEKILSVCPDSITDVTTRNETALHIALKNNNLEAFKFLVGWLLREWPYWSKILEQKDVEGNTVLHIAVSRNQTQAALHILAWDETCFNVKEKNFEGKTALEILYEQDQQRQGADISEIRGRTGADTLEEQTQGADISEIQEEQQTHRADISEIRVRSEGQEEQQTQGAGISEIRGPLEGQQKKQREKIRKILERGALRPVTPSHEHYQELPGCYRRKKIKFFGNQMRKRISDENRNAFLVVAALLVTVTYQAAITPPGGLWQEDLFEANTTAPHRAGSAIARGTLPFSIFTAFNSIIFLSSIATMVVLVPPDDVVGSILAVVSAFLYFGYFSSLMIITQAPDWLARIVLLSPVIISAVGYAFFIVGKDRFDSHES